MVKNEKLKQAIKDSGYSYESLAREINTSKQTIQNAVNGEKIHHHTQLVIAMTLGCELNDIFGEV